MSKKKLEKPSGINYLLDSNIKAVREKGKTSMFIDKKLLTQFKINLIKINKNQTEFFDTEIRDFIANYNEQIPLIKNAKTDQSVQYVITIYKDTSKELNLFCAKTDIAIRDICVYLMNRLDIQIKTNLNTNEI